MAFISQKAVALFALNVSHNIAVRGGPDLTKMLPPNQGDNKNKQPGAVTVKGGGSFYWRRDNDRLGGILRIFKDTTTICQCRGPGICTS